MSLLCYYADSALIVFKETDGREKIMSDVKVNFFVLFLPLQTCRALRWPFNCKPSFLLLLFWCSGESFLQTANTILPSPTSVSSLALLSAFSRKADVLFSPYFVMHIKELNFLLFMSTQAHGTHSPADTSSTWKVLHVKAVGQTFEDRKSVV